MSPDEQYRGLSDKYETALREWREASEGLTEEELHRRKLDVHPGRNARNFSAGFMDLARKYPGTTAAEDALIWVGSHVFQTRDSEEAKRRLIRDHIRSAKLDTVLGYQGHYGDYFEGSEAFFRRAIAESPHRKIQGQACYWLARHLLYKGEGVRRATDDPDFGQFQGVDLYKETYGPDWATRLRRLDPEVLAKEAESLFERVAKDYADVPHNDKRRDPGPLGEVALAYHERRDLAIGKRAPESEGTDLDGQRFRLADYRYGKVLVLDFGSHFCGLCHETYPRMRALTERLKGRPFAIISINAEPEKSLKDLKDAWNSAGNTWRCLFDGTWEGPIQKAWNVQEFPTIYLVDAEGVIRGKDLPDKALEEAIDKLLREAGGAQ